MPNREIQTHKSNGLNDGLTILATDEPGPGGANHEYTIHWYNHTGAMRRTTLNFQKGGVQELQPRSKIQNGINGLSMEALLAVVADRLECFQAGPFACPENGEALSHVTLALQGLHQRTAARVARGVEGKEQK